MVAKKKKQSVKKGRATKRKAARPTSSSKRKKTSSTTTKKRKKTSSTKRTTSKKRKPTSGNRARNVTTPAEENKASAQDAWLLVPAPVDLTPKQIRWAQEYLVDLNATRAAVRTGYSEKSADIQGFRMSKNVKVMAYVDRLKAARAERTGVSAERVLLELARIGLSDIGEMFIWDDERCAFIPSTHLSNDQRAAISSIKSRTINLRHLDGTLETKTFLELKTYDKVAALKEIGKHLGIGENVNLFVRDGVSELTDDELAARAKKLARRVVSKGKE